MPKVYVVLPVHNRWQSTRAFLMCMRQQTFNDVKVVICNDGSTDGTEDRLREEFPEVVTLAGSGSLWWTAGINRCVSWVLEHAADDDFVLTINNDVLVHPEFVSQKVKRAADLPGAIIGSLCVFQDDPNRVETSGFIMDYGRCESTSVTKRGQTLTRELTGVRRVTHLPGKGVLVPVSMFRKLGLYDERGLPQYHADTDFTLRAHEAGVPVYVDFDSLVLSDVNLRNMSSPTQKMTLHGIVRTFQGPYSPNNWQVNLVYARKHFPTRYVQFLVRKYIRVLGGMFRRYAAWHWNRFTGRYGQ